MIDGGVVVLFFAIKVADGGDQLMPQPRTSQGCIAWLLIKTSICT